MGCRLVWICPNHWGVVVRRLRLRETKPSSCVNSTRTSTQSVYLFSSFKTIGIVKTSDYSDISVSYRHLVLPGMCSLNIAKAGKCANRMLATSILYWLWDCLQIQLIDIHQLINIAIFQTLLRTRIGQAIIRNPIEYNTCHCMNTPVLHVLSYIMCFFLSINIV